MKNFLILVFLIFSISVSKAQETGGPYTTDVNTVLLMHFDGDAINSSGVGNNGVAHGTGVSYETGVHGQALRLDNSTADKQSWIEVPFYDGLNLTDDFSIEFWFKPASKKDGYRQALLFKENSKGASQYGVYVGNDLNSMEAFLDCDTLNNRDWTLQIEHRLLNLEADKWYHIAFYYKYDRRRAFLLLRDENYNEKYFAEGYSASNPFIGNGKLSIGAEGGISCFDGWIDELRISNKKRTYRDDILKDVDVSSFKEEVKLQLKDSWGSYQWPLGELFPIDEETGEVYRKNHCGPTALGRALHYWEYPRFPSGVIQHTMNGYNWYADLENTEYLWDLMPDNFPSDVTVEEYTPAALFMMHMGTASRESYDYMSCYPEFLINHFHYSPKTRILNREDYTKEEWINILKNELNNGRPIVAGGVIKETLTGDGGVAGHYYVIDGYNKNNEFHTDYSLGDNVWDDPDNFDYGFGMSIIAFLEPDWNDKTLEIKSPTKNSHLKSGTELEIKWESSNIANVIIEYSDDAGANWSVITESINAAAGSYTWTVPATVSKNYKIRISDTENLNIYRRTNTFEVYNEKNFEFKNPGNNAILTGGIEQPVYWESSGISAFKLEYSTDNGSTWIVLSDSVNTQENYTYTFPEIETENGMLRATDINDPGQIYLSNYFQISSLGNNNFLYGNEVGTELLMHFENNLDNAANNAMYAVEGLTIGEYVDNYDLNLGKAFQFDNGPGLSPMGIYLWVYNSNNLDLENNWTMECWVNTQSIGDSKTGFFPIIIDKENVCGIQVDHGMQGFYAYLNFENETGISFFQNQTLDLDKWYHLSLISDSASQSVNFYIHNQNGELIYENYQSFPEGSNGLLKQNQNPLLIGGNAHGNRFFDGYIDEVRVTKNSYLSDYIEIVELPFFDDFENEYQNWQTLNKTGFDWWHISGDDGTDGSKCARFSTNMEAPFEINDDWLLSKKFNTKDYSKISISFKYWYYGNGLVPEIVYSKNYVRDIEQADWIKLDNSSWGQEWTWNTALFEIENPGDNITLAIRYQSDESHASYLLIDDFSIEGTLTGNKLKQVAQNDLKVYPNPVTNQSVISFKTKISGPVDLSVFDIQGRKIGTLLNKKLNAGMHTIPLSNSLPGSGIYIGKLITSEGISTLKIITN